MLKTTTPPKPGGFLLRKGCMTERIKGGQNVPEPSPIQAWARENQSGAVISDSSHPLHSLLPEMLQQRINTEGAVVIVDMNGNLNIRHNPNEKQA